MPAFQHTGIAAYIHARRKKPEMVPVRQATSAAVSAGDVTTIGRAPFRSGLFDTGIENLSFRHSK